MNLPRFEAAVRLSVDGQTSRPFVMHTLPKPEVTDPEVANQAIQRSAQLHGRPVAEIDQELHRALHLGDPTPAVRQIGRRSRR